MLFRLRFAGSPPTFAQREQEVVSRCVSEILKFFDALVLCISREPPDPKGAVSVLGNESRRRVSFVARLAEQSLRRAGMFAEIFRDLRTRKVGEGHGARDSDTLDPESRRASISNWSWFPNPHGAGNRAIVSFRTLLAAECTLPVTGHL
jgi:hypothetical protein